MYHCHTIFYLVGQQAGTFDPVRELAPLEGFTHELLESSEPERSLAARAGVILADLRGSDPVKTAHALASWKAPEAQLILLAEEAQTAELFQNLPQQTTDVWSLPMGPAQWRFRLGKWQRDWKAAKDA